MTGTVKLDGWQPQEMPDAEMCARLRQYASEAIFAYWHEHHAPISLQQIYTRVQDRIAGEWGNLWPTKWGNPCKRTVDRRVNECADPKFYSDGISKIASSTAGEYLPNPALFAEEEHEIINCDEAWETLEKKALAVKDEEKRRRVCGLIVETRMLMEEK